MPNIPCVNPWVTFFIGIFLEEGWSEIYRSFALCGNTCLYLLRPCKITTHAKNMNEPILERGMMGQTYEMEIFSKIFKKLGLESQISPNFIVFEEFLSILGVWTGVISPHLKIFSFHMFTLSFCFPKWAHSYFHHD